MSHSNEIDGLPAELPHSFESFTLKDTVPGQSFWVRYGFMHVDEEGHGWLRADADINMPLSNLRRESQLCVVLMEEGYFVDLVASVPKADDEIRFERRDLTKLFESGAKFHKIAGFVSSSRQQEVLKRRFFDQFARELEYPAPFTVLEKLEHTQTEEAPKTRKLLSRTARSIATVGLNGVIKVAEKVGEATKPTLAVADTNETFLSADQTIE